MSLDGAGVNGGPEGVPAREHPSLVGLLRGRAEARPDQGVYAFSADGTEAGEGPVLTLGGLDARARAVGAWLQERGLAGERVLLVFPPGLEFVSAFFGCLYAGAVAVPAAAPRANRPMDRLRAVVDAARPAALLTTGGQLPAARQWREQAPALGDAHWLGVEAVPEALAANWRDPGAGPETLAFLQYTSGSTAAPKGVMVTHGNLLHNAAVIRRCFAAGEGSRGVFWLPLFHDMGLIGGVLQTLDCGGYSTLMSPVAFLQRPVRWLDAVSRTGATISGGPNFAYDLCARKVTDEQKAGLDLSRWSVAFNGAEPVRAETLDRFAEAFAPCGFRREAFLPCYGLAESTLMVTGKRAEESPKVFTVRGADLERDRAIEALASEPGARVLIGSGRAFEGLRVAVVDPETARAQPDGHVGEVWVRGPSVAAGYWGRPDATAETFAARLDGEDAPFLRTGDLGFLRDGELFVTGRLKDLMIVRGRNVYPQDVEWSAAHAHPLARAEGGAAFAVEIDGDERLVVVQEVERLGKGVDPDEVIGAIRKAVAEQHDLDLHAVCLIRAMSLPKTSSGKVQRHACRAAFLAGTLDAVAASVRATDAARPAVAESPARSAAEIERWLVARLAGTLGLDPAAVDVRRPFAAFGLGSLQAVGLAGELEQWLGRTLAPTLIYDHPTVEDLARHLAGGPRQAPEVGSAVGEAGPVAVVGIGCRFPGADGPDAFWDLLSAGVDAVGEPPASRRGLGQAGADRAGFLDRVDLFDAGFFGIAPREAVWTDPQQRLLLEVAWEALEDAGLDPDRLRGRDVGVFVGVSTNDYGRGRLGEANEAYAVTGNALSVAANRLSYAFDFRGPSLAVDTACSSSLVALHLACESLRRGETAVALAGGVNVVLDRGITGTFAAGGFLAPDGRCKTFDASADGYVRGEGAAVVVLKPLAAALADGDPVYAVVLGSAVNQDGRSNGLTAPNRDAQEAVLRAAYRRAGVSPGAVDYVEAHGTGTLLGDPIEAAALAAVVAEGRPEGQPCAVGSVKTNIGHLEAAAGIAGVIKVALALSRGSIPPSLHFHDPNPHIPFARLPIRVQTEAGPWPEHGRAWLAGVSAFGFGGTNAHAVLEAPPRREAGSDAEGPFLVPLSARTPKALRDLARSYRDLLSGDAAPPLAAVAHTAGVRRAHHDHRLAFVARTLPEAVERLDAFLRGESAPGLAVGRRSPSRRPRVAFVFSGQGSQWRGMGHDLAGTEPVFRAALDECDRHFRALLGWSVIEELAADEGASRLEETGHAQPAVFAVQVALVALWRSWGVGPDAVTGHSLGEAAAAFAAGALSLGDAARVVAHRARLMQSTAGRGRTVAVALPEAEAARLVAADPERLALAGVNGPDASVISGDTDAVLGLARTLRGRGVLAKVLTGDCAFHSPQMDPLCGALREALAGLAPGPASVPIVSTVTGRPIEGTELGPGYWARNLRETVRFAEAAGHLVGETFDAFLEIGPHPALAPALADLLGPGDRPAAVLGSLRRGDAAREVLLGSVAELYARGFPVDWTTVNAAGGFCRLPTYPFQRERFWLDVKPATAIGGHALPHANGNGHPRRNGHAAPAEAPHAGFFEIEWQPRERTGFSGSGPRGTWLVVGDGGGVGAALRARLDGAGARCVMAAPEATTAWLEGAGPRAGVVDLRCLDAPPTAAATADGLDAAVRGCCEGVVELARALGDGRGPGAARLWVVTAGAQPAGDRPGPLALAQAPVWGLGRSVALDRPAVWGGLVDLDPEDLPGGAASLAAELLGPAGEDQVAFRLGKRYVARLVRRQRLDDLPGTLPVRPEGTYLVTGGLGELGLKVTRRLVEQGARRVVLVGRGGLPDRPEWDGLAEGGEAARRVDEVRALERLGATVHAAAVDVADAAAMAALFDDLRRLFPPVRGVVHAAGVVTPQALADLDPEALAGALRPKVAGTWVLHEQTLGLPLDFFVAFSSVASVLGAREAHYAAANHFLDAFAHHRRALGLPAVSVNWGPWEGPGMAAGADRGRAFAALGVRPLRVDDGLDALAGLVASGATQAVVADADWHALRDLFGADGRRPLLDALADRGRATRGEGRRFDWRGGSPEASRGRLLGFLRDRLAGVLKLDPGNVDTERPLDTMGLDSLMAIELKNGVESELGAALPLASLLQGPSLDRLAGTLLDQLSGGVGRSTPIEAALPTDAEVSDAPLTAGQRALWSLHHIDPESPAYHIVGAVRVPAPLDPDALRRTAQRLVDRHPALRTTLPAGRGEPVQRVRRRAEVAFHFEDASDADPAELLRRLNAEANRPFDLENGPLFRIHLFRRSEADHALMLAMHHAVGDFWSVAVLLDELGRIYPAELAGRAPELPALPVTYADFARWQRTMLDGPEGRRHWDYWRDRLAGPLPALNLPTDRPRPPVQTFRGAVTATHLDADLTPRLVGLGSRLGASLYATLLTGFQVLLARYSGQDDVVVGAPVAGRNRSEVSGVVGYFVNTLPVRTKVEPGLSFATLLGRVREAVVGGLDHQDFPFAVMADRVSSPRDPSRPAVFSVMFVLQKAQRLDDLGFTSFVLKGAGPSMELGGFPVESIALEGHGAQFDLTMQVAEDRGRLAVSVEYNTDLFDAATIDRLLGHYRVLLGAAADDPDRPVGDLPLLTAAEREQLDGWNATETPGEPAGFPELFERQAERTPAAVAVAAADGVLSYRTLNARANRLAHRLRAVGVGPESRVAVCVGRSAAAPVAVLGVLKAGGGYVPLDPEYPADRLAFMVADSGAGVIVTDGASLGAVPEGPARVVLLDDDLDGDDQNPAPVAGPDDLAYMIYTSGSTGRPKGVLVTHRNLAHSTHARLLYYAEPVAGYLLVSSFAFDSSVAGIFWTLAQGGKLVIPAPGEHADPLALARLVGRHGVSHFLGVPSLYALILENAPADELVSLRAVIVAGEPCPSGLPARHFEAIPGAALYNEYGPTEATVWATVHRCDPADPAAASVPIGRPVAGTRAYVLDARRNPVPVGVTGELYLGGVGLARGYYGRPALTAERFLADPFSGEPGARLYRTGDLARFRPDGLIECLGRADGQVKVRGHRVELGEVEAALAGHPAVREAAAAARVEPSGETRLVAYLVGRPGAELSAVGLRNWLKARLPDAMVPSTFAALGALPLSPNGKVDRAALPDPSAFRLAGPALSEPPRNPAEAELARLAAGLLKVDRVGVHDNVFELGMDSILAIQLVARARKGGLHLTPAQLFQAPTVAGMAEAAGAWPVGRASGVVAPAEDPLDALDPARRQRLGASGRLVEDAYPLTPTQEGMLFHTRYAKGSGVYVQQFACVLRGALDLPAFARAWRRLCDRHPVLRTAFDGGDAGRPLQVVYRGVEPPWHEADWRALGAGGQAEALDDYLRADRHRGFATDTPPLMRLAVFRLGDDAHQFVWSYHHLLFDGWSLPVLLREVLELYEGAAWGRAVALPPRPPFRDYVTWLRAEDPARAEPFWRDFLKGFREPTPLGITRAWGDDGDDDDDDGGYDEQDARLSTETTAALAAQARRRGLTLSTVVQGAWALLLSRYSGRADVVFGSTVSGRSAPVDGVEDMVGLFINTLPVRVTVVAAEPAAAWLARLQGVLVGLRRFEATPLVLVQGWSEVPRGRPLFESLFVFENYPVDASLTERAGGPGVGSVRVDERTHYPLTLMAFPGSQLRVRAEYATGRFDPVAVDRLLGHLVRLLEGLADDPDRPIDALPILTTPEMQQLLDQWNDPRDEPAPRADRPGLAERDPAGADAAPGLDHLSDEEVEALIGEYLGREGDFDE